ncbi:ribosomal protein S18-alanine N-acetyltransferase [Kocuria sp. JC486]|uniref:ribosomal protein S18-alanine N-acetyltransferase n=1 Tax=Kocuria sp. JC486 TaxID=1970736 RepID=UPI00142096B9|nr:ribosomal protein S18-alanine N-acetyltransferase [Kocuria sp. JC486]
MSSQAGTWRLRAATVADVADIEHLEQQIFPDDAWSLEMILGEVTHPTRSYWVAMTGESPEERVIGYAGVMVVGDTADVQNIAVVPGMEGRGIGTALLTRLHQEAVDRGAREVLLEVRVDNQRAQDLYRRFGYRDLTVRPRYYPGGVDALVMHAELAPPRPPSTTDLTGHMTTSQRTSHRIEDHDRDQ